MYSLDSWESRPGLWASTPARWDLNKESQTREVSRRKVPSNDDGSDNER
jgi:hypothetical protein